MGPEKLSDEDLKSLYRSLGNIESSLKAVHYRVTEQLKNEKECKAELLTKIKDIGGQLANNDNRIQRLEDWCSRQDKAIELQMKRKNLMIAIAGLAVGVISILVGILLRALGV